MPIFISKCPHCGREFKNDYVRNLTYCSVACQVSAALGYR